MRASTRVQIEQVATLTLMGFKGPVIAEELGISVRTVESIRRRSEYKIRCSQIQRELLTRMDQALFISPIGPMLHPEASPAELRLLAARTIKLPLDDTPL